MHRVTCSALSIAIPFMLGACTTPYTPPADFKVAATLRLPKFEPGAVAAYVMIGRGDPTGCAAMQVASPRDKVFVDSVRIEPNIRTFAILGQTTGGISGCDLAVEFTLQANREYNLAYTVDYSTRTCKVHLTELRSGAWVPAESRPAYFDGISTKRACDARSKV